MDNLPTNDPSDFMDRAEEAILTYIVPDEALEVAALGPIPLVGSLSSSCFACHCIE